MHCVVTSPPYYGLRDYGTAQWDGGDAGCEHKADIGARASSGLNGSLAHKDGRVFTPYRDICGKCGARRIDRQIGLEATPDEYIATMVEVFREVRRVLRDDGTCWVNMGDSYAHGASGGGSVFDNGRNDGRVSYEADKPRGRGAFRTNVGLADKQLLMMPARLALALQADGWWLRSQIVWAKPNPMPESVTDRPTSAYELVYLLSKRSKYFYDNEGVREEANWSAKMPDGWDTGPGAHGSVHRNGREAGANNGASGNGRNLRNVWTLATQSFPDSHFATFPTALAERCIRAGTSERGCCAQCGTPWVRVTQETAEYAAVKARLREKLGPDFHMKRAGTDAVKGIGTGTNPATLPPKNTTTGWQPGCTHGADIVPATVLDCFAGAGTTLLVADRLQRNAIGIELNAAYTEMAMERCRRDAPLFADLHPPPAEDPEDERMRDLFATAAD